MDIIILTYANHRVGHIPSNKHNNLVVPQIGVMVLLLSQLALIHCQSCSL